MKWLIQFPQDHQTTKDLIVDIDDLIADDRWLWAQVGERKIQYKYIHALQTIVIKTPYGEKNLRARRIHIEQFPQDSEARVRVEQWHGDQKSVRNHDFKIQRFSIGAKSSKEKNSGAIPIRAPLTGKLLSITVNDGDQVQAGQTLCTIEAMKMENKINAPQAGRVESVKVKKGDAVTVGRELMVLKP